MFYSDEELKSWWDQLGGFDKEDLFDRIIKNSTSTYKLFIEDLRKDFRSGKRLSVKQLQVLRKWARD